MHHAAIHNQSDSMQILIEHGATIGQRDSSCFSELYYCVSKGYYECLQVLLENKANVEDKFNKETPLIIATKNNHPDIVKALLNTGANVKSDVEGRMVLLFSCIEGYSKITETILNLRKSVNLEAYNNTNNTSMNCAAGNNHFECLKLLLNHINRSLKADVDHKGNKGETENDLMILPSVDCITVKSIVCIYYETK